MKNAFRAYEFAHVEPVVRVQIQSNSFQAGAILVMFAPLMTTAQAASVYNGELHSQSVAQHIVMYAGKNQSVEMRIPFIHPYKYLDLMNSGAWNSLGTLMIYALSPLRVGPAATSTSANISIFARFENASFQVVNPTDVTVVPQGGVSSKVINNNLSGVFTNSTVDAKSGGDSFKGGDTPVTVQDKPNWGINPFPFMYRQLPNLTNSTNVDFCEVLETDPSLMAPVRSQETGISVDEMNILYQCKRLTYYDTWQLNASNVLGDVLGVADLAPCDEFLSAPSGTVVSLSLLSYMTLPFSFWRGSLKYKFVAVCSPMHTARLQICSHVGFASQGLTINEAFGQYVCIFDVVGTSEIVVEFPWRSPTDWKKVLNGSYANTLPYSMGQFSLRVLNPLQAPEVVASTIDILVYIAGGDGYQVSYLGTNSADVQVAAVLT